MFAVATTQAVETGQNRAVRSGNADSPKAKDTDTKDTDTKATGAKETKTAKPAGPPPSKLWIVNTLRSHPELVIFLTLAIGYYIGGVKMGSFSLGSVTGTLLVGVDDQSGIVGIEADRFQNEDRYLLHFNNMIRQHIGLEHAALIQFRLRELGGRKILVVDCRRSQVPVFVRHGNDEDFYVRVGPGTRKLATSTALEYIGRNFGST
jgi:hypothetical protein